MKKYDCSKVLDFKHERMRMCEMTDGCDICCLGHLQRLGGETCELMCDCLSDITEDEIAALQKWSDEHPEKTRAEAFLERIPNCVKENRRPNVCWLRLVGRYDCDHEYTCAECWNMPYNGEFEKEGKNETD